MDLKKLLRNVKTLDDLLRVIHRAGLGETLVESLNSVTLYEQVDLTGAQKSWDKPYFAAWIEDLSKWGLDAVRSASISTGCSVIGFEQPRFGLNSVDHNRQWLLEGSTNDIAGTRADDPRWRSAAILGRLGPTPWDAPWVNSEQGFVGRWFRLFPGFYTASQLVGWENAGIASIRIPAGYSVTFKAYREHLAEVTVVGPLTQIDFLGIHEDLANNWTSHADSSKWLEVVCTTDPLRPIVSTDELRRREDSSFDYHGSTQELQVGSYTASEAVATSASEFHLLKIAPTDLHSMYLPPGWTVKVYQSVDATGLPTVTWSNNWVRGVFYDFGGIEAWSIEVS